MFQCGFVSLLPSNKTAQHSAQDVTQKNLLKN